MYHFVCILKCIYVNMFYYLDILKTDKINNLLRYFLDNIHLSTVHVQENLIFQGDITCIDVAQQKMYNAYIQDTSH